jgi:glutamine phosphoribosylpyrophosphate amidotransferase
MCGVIGVWLEDVIQDDLDLVRRVFDETMIRGKHATGLSYVKGGKVHTIKESVPVTWFFNNKDNKKDLKDYVNEDGNLYLIGHIRYSTSDLRYNQPFSDDGLSIAHNGVISQEDPSTWKYKCETANDSEMIFHSMKAGMDPLTDFDPASMAVVALNSNKELMGFRNNERPLYFSPRTNGVIFTSTADIAKRAGLTISKKCHMFTRYTIADGDMIIDPVKYDDNIQDLQ